MANGFALSLDISEQAQDLAAQVTATTQALEKAAQMALQLTAKWLRTHALREIGQVLGIKQAPLKQRMRIYPHFSKNAVSIWVGLSPIGVHRLGSPRITPQGVQVKRKHYNQAFINPMRSTEPLVFRRSGKQRLPIERVEEEIETEALEVLKNWERRVMQRFGQLFEQQIKRIQNASP